MPYKFANNDHVYSSYESRISSMLQKNTMDFLSSTNGVGVFDVSVDFGKKYCKQIADEFPEETRDIKDGKYRKEIDLFFFLGSPDIFFSDELNTLMSANCARYIYHAILISKYMSKKFQHVPFDVVEIGGGYGGLCYWLRVFQQSIQTYTIVDLPIACKLQQKCLTYLKTERQSITDSNTFKKGSLPVFVISNYGYSEFNEYYQNLYKTTILSKADAGFMIWNNWTGIYSFTDAPLLVENERPFLTEFTINFCTSNDLLSNVVLDQFLLRNWSNQTFRFIYRFRM